MPDVDMDKLDQLLAEILDDEAEALGPESPFTECPGWDSLKHVELIVGIETRFAVDLSAAEIASMRSKSSTRAVLAGRGRL